MPVANRHARAPCGVTAYTYASSDPKYMVPSDPREGVEKMFPPVTYLQCRDPLAVNNAYSALSFPPTYTM